MFKTIIWSLLLLLLLASCAEREPVKQHLIIAVASNMQPAIAEIAAKFSSMHSISVEVASAASGVLSTQVRQGAPFDVFVSANMRYPKNLQNAGLTVGAIQPFAFGSLILWSAEQMNLSSGIYLLQNNGIDNFAMANPETAPYGIAALQALKNAKLADLLQNKIVLGESVAQVNQYVASGAVPLGLTSRSVLYSAGLDQSGASKDVNRSLYQPIVHAVVILKHAAESNRARAKLFFQFMFSTEAKLILNAHGYETLAD